MNFQIQLSRCRIGLVSSNDCESDFGRHSISESAFRFYPRIPFHLFSIFKFLKKILSHQIIKFSNFNFYEEKLDWTHESIPTAKTISHPDSEGLLTNFQISIFFEPFITFFRWWIPSCSGEFHFLSRFSHFCVRQSRS